MDDRGARRVQRVWELLHGGERQHNEDGRVSGQRELSPHQFPDGLWWVDHYLRVPRRLECGRDAAAADRGERSPVDSSMQGGGVALHPGRASEPRVPGPELLQHSRRRDAVVLDFPHWHGAELCGEDDVRDGGVHGPEFCEAVLRLRVQLRRDSGDVRHGGHGHWFRDGGDSSIGPDVDGRELVAAGGSVYSGGHHSWCGDGELDVGGRAGGCGVVCGVQGVVHS
mmetsp:Transcript_33570/g.62613  ORF Transcript_33570/g.62613 Transcript_33570/m.62613 type:complete len:225 (-) Transcript_33570:252-926(-)